MTIFKSLRAAEPAEDPDVVARLNGIAARSKAEASLYQAIEKARRSQGDGPRPKKRFKKA